MVLAADGVQRGYSREVPIEQGTLYCGICCGNLSAHTCEGNI